MFIVLRAHFDIYLQIVGAGIGLSDIVCSFTSAHYCYDSLHQIIKLFHQLSGATFGLRFFFGGLGEFGAWRLWGGRRGGGAVAMIRFTAAPINIIKNPLRNATRVLNEGERPGKVYSERKLMVKLPSSR
jgi:hypothetical protein